MHLSLHVRDLQASLAFYRTLFGQSVSKERSAYAKFELEEPALVFTLMEGGQGAPPAGALSHLGLRLPDRGALESERKRVRAAGLPIHLEEEGVECCYARQDKFWVRDPDGHAWEFYVFLADSESQPGPKAEASCCGPDLACSEGLC